MYSITFYFEYSLPYLKNGKTAKFHAQAKQRG